MLGGPGDIIDAGHAEGDAGEGMRLAKSGLDAVEAHGVPAFAGPGSGHLLLESFAVDRDAACIVDLGGVEEVTAAFAETEEVGTGLDTIGQAVRAGEPNAR
jgi:hypothetical protein